jgi:hypothetical protein
MTERYAKLAKHHIANTGSTAREMWEALEPNCDKRKHRMIAEMCAYCAREEIGFSNCW